VPWAHLTFLLATFLYPPPYKLPSLQQLFVLVPIHFPSANLQDVLTLKLVARCSLSFLHISSLTRRGTVISVARFVAPLFLSMKDFCFGKGVPNRQPAFQGADGKFSGDQHLFQFRVQSIRPLRLRSALVRWLRAIVRRCRMTAKKGRHRPWQKVAFEKKRIPLKRQNFQTVS